jgi:hypothetical protein
MPPDVVRILASSTVLVKASSLVNLDLAGMAVGMGGVYSMHAGYALGAEGHLCDAGFE